MRKSIKIIIAILSAISAIGLVFSGALYYLGGLGYLYYSQNVVKDIYFFFAVAILALLFLAALIIMMYKCKCVLKIIATCLLVVFIPIAFYFSFIIFLGVGLFGPNGCSYTQDITNYGKYDEKSQISYFPVSTTEDMEIVDFSYYYKYIDTTQLDIYLEVKFNDKETMDKYLTMAKNAFSKNGYVTYQNPYNPKYTDIFENKSTFSSTETGVITSYIFFRQGSEDYKYIDMNYNIITYSYDEFTIIYNYTCIGSDIEVGDNPEKAEYYPKYLKRFDVEWNPDNNISYKFIKEK